MPICLPSNKRFNDSKRRVTSLGKEHIYRFTDGNGPEGFQPCALTWVGPSSRTKDFSGKFDKVMTGCSTDPQILPRSLRPDAPRSAEDLCQKKKSSSNCLKLIAAGKLGWCATCKVRFIINHFQ